MPNNTADTLFAEKLQALLTELKQPSISAIDASAWFLGPKAENHQALIEMVTEAAQSHIATRRNYMPDDPPIFKEVTEKHKYSIQLIREQLHSLLNKLQGSIPLASYRNQSHMYWDLTLPGTVGYFAAMLYNQNNVAAEASPVTTVMEYLVGQELCKMLGFETSEDAPIKAWGHITCDGSVANGESMWAARNLKYLPVALAAAIKTEEDLKAARNVTIETCEGKSERLIDMEAWTLLNLPIDSVIGLVEIIAEQSQIEEKIIRKFIDKYSVQNIGLIRFQQYLKTAEQATPVVIAPATAHYSWPKTAALIGLGTDSVELIKVDLEGRMSMQHLQEVLEKCLADQRPILQVVAVMGSTGEGAVDPLADILTLRDKYQAQGLNFVVHVDGAWGGYFTSMIRTPDPRLGSDGDQAEIIDQYPSLYLSQHFKTHFNEIHRADSITLDPHKSGFIPYPAGSLCYRNGNMRALIAYTSPVVYHGGVDLTVGPYGIEGSKPGAAAASVYLSHRVIPLNTRGYGRILGRCLFNSKRFYAALVSMAIDDDFNITILQRLPSEKQGKSEEEILAQKLYLKNTIVPCRTDELIEQVFGLPEPATEDQKEALETFQSIGSDLSILTYAFNFKTVKGWNRDLGQMNLLNTTIFNKLSLHPPKDGKLPDIEKIPDTEMFVTGSELVPHIHGKTLINDICRRAGVDTASDTGVNMLISTTQNPWLSSTSGDRDMIETLIEVLRKTVRESIIDITTLHPSTSND